MNAMTDTLPRAAVAPHATHTFKLLLKREFWEHKGGFFWAPVAAGGISLLLAAMGSIWATVTSKHRGNAFEIQNPEKVKEVLGAAGDMALLSGVAIASIVLGFVVFFYALGSLYDERRDRSVLFWKSMPVSDTATVASKAAWAAVLAPLLAIAIGLLIGFGMWLLGMATTTVNGISGASGILTESHPLRIAAQVFAAVPVYTLWALPAIGWLMLCSAFARTKPFLWAVMVPVLGCALVSIASLMFGAGLDTDRMWYVFGFRMLLSVFPGSWMPAHDERIEHLDGPHELPRVFEAISGFEVLGTADLWIGAVAGLAMIAAATRLRRWRDEG